MGRGTFPTVIDRRDKGGVVVNVFYKAVPLGTTDASVIAIAERLKLTEVATLDRRHFNVVRPGHVDTLTLPP